MTLHCEGCDGFYELPNAKTEKFRLTILFFAQCPHCGMLRCERSKNYPYPRCKQCNIPIPDRPARGPTKLLGIEVSLLCRAHYVGAWRKSRFVPRFLQSEP